VESGYVQLRRGILEHLESRRITFEEYSIYTLIILKADHRTGQWQGCASTLAKLTGKSERWCRYRLAELRSKGYLTAGPSNGRGSYVICVARYFQKRHGGAASDQEAARGCRFPFQKRHGGAAYSLQHIAKRNTYSPEEVNKEQEEVLQEGGRPKRVDDYPVLRMLG
jgi:hypothetical protein